MAENQKHRRHVFMFQPRFAPLVLDGSKTTTIRAKRKREVLVGDIMDFRQWSGRPYASKQIKLFEAVCINTIEFRLDSDWQTRKPRIYLQQNHKDKTIGWDWRMLSYEESRGVSVDDGFETFSDLINWFKQTHGLPFYGTLYRWRKNHA